MLDLDDIETLECDEEASVEDEARALQHAINEGCWGMQGSYGRSMMGALEAGYCILGTTGKHDYYGSYIPSRTEVKRGTKGSIGYARKMQPDFWAGRKTKWADTKAK